MTRIFTELSEARSIYSSISRHFNCFNYFNSFNYFIYSIISLNFHYLAEFLKSSFAGSLRQWSILFRMMPPQNVRQWPEPFREQRCTVAHALTRNTCRVVTRNVIRSSLGSRDRPARQLKPLPTEPSRCRLLRTAGQGQTDLP